MNTLLFPVLFLFVGNHSLAQSDSNSINRRGRETFYYIDGVKVQGSIPDSVQKIEAIQIITGGVPEPYSDLNSGIIPRPTVPVAPAIPSPRDKKENLQTE